MQPCKLYLMYDDGTYTEHRVVLPAGVDEDEFIRIPMTSPVTPETDHDIYATISALINVCDAGDQELIVVAKRIGTFDDFMTSQGAKKGRRKDAAAQA